MTEELEQIEAYRAIQKRIHRIAGSLADEPSRWTDYDRERELLAQLAKAVEEARRILG